MTTHERPRIGIRPVTDPRAETGAASRKDTLALAGAVAKLLATSLRHADGEPVECVVPEYCITGLAESDKVRGLFRSRDVGATITVTQTWAYGSEVMDYTADIPKAVWGVNGTNWPGAVFGSAVRADYDQKKIPVFFIYGRHIQDAGDLSIPVDVQAKLLVFAKAAIAVASMRNKTHLSLGGVCMGMAGSTIEPSFLDRYLDMRYLQMDMTEVARRIERNVFDQDELEKALGWAKEKLTWGA